MRSIPEGAVDLCPKKFLTALKKLLTAKVAKKGRKARNGKLGSREEEHPGSLSDLCAPFATFAVKSFSTRDMSLRSIDGHALAR
jgi:hypothetical protein